jgi:cell division protein FtsB
VNRPSEALKYHKLLLENEAKRYDNDKITAMDDMLVKYETEKKKEEIDRLTEQNQTAQQILILTISLIAVLLVALLFFIRFHKLRKKNLEQSVYESALLAELKQTELEQNQKEKDQLQQQYNKLETQANRNKQKAQPYIAELEKIKQQLEQKLTQTMVEKLTEWISKSAMEKPKRDFYLKQLSKLDIDLLEQGYLFADEKISTMEMKYIVCFAINMDVKDTSLLFNVEPGTVRTVRYRIKKKFGGKNTFKFLI